MRGLSGTVTISTVYISRTTLSVYVQLEFLTNIDSEHPRNFSTAATPYTLRPLHRCKPFETASFLTLYGSLNLFMAFRSDIAYKCNKFYMYLFVSAWFKPSVRAGTDYVHGCDSTRGKKVAKALRWRAINNTFALCIIQLDSSPDDTEFRDGSSIIRTTVNFRGT